MNLNTIWRILSFLAQHEDEIIAVVQKVKEAKAKGKK